MIIKSRELIQGSEITPESIYKQRRFFMKAMMGSAALLSSGLASAIPSYAFEDDWPKYPGPKWLQDSIVAYERNAAYSTTDEAAPYPSVITHNNFYEFGLGKQDPSRKAQSFKSDPWNVEVVGEAAKTGVYALEDLVSPYRLEERVYPLRCVEGWSMVIPWLGIPLADLLKRFEPSGNAKYVEFTTLHDPEQMPGQRGAFSTIAWPYVEGLRIDEAMHPLSFLAVGVYGQALPPQNGAPLRLVVPWKYGFKSIKSIVKIRFTETMPISSWNKTAPNEYGFFANVNPEVDHPRWSQATERRLPSSLFSPNIIDTLPFNGYADQVASLYTGMDLRKWY
jgi:sulfoxide reductase catalytic subunit YedY